jgi:hypothetical protein
MSEGVGMSEGNDLVRLALAQLKFLRYGGLEKTRTSDLFRVKEAL